jgi:hypothetical protein
VAMDGGPVRGCSSTVIVSPYHENEREVTAGRKASISVGMALKCSVCSCMVKLGKVCFHCLAAFISMDCGPHYRKDNR